jgi:CubicO group peptidase (beta-lactamase class C family)
VFRAATGRDIEEYAQRHLLAPLGIRDWFWKRTPTGLADTEGGLYLRIGDLARIAYLFLKKGVWNGRAVVSPEWVTASVSPSVTVGTAGVRYGYKWWLLPYPNGDTRFVWAGSGFGGQRPLVFPDEDLVAVFTGWNIRAEGPGLSPREAVDRILSAVKDHAPKRQTP